jgi:hypothetical protein
MTEIDFERLNPCIASFPHCIFQASSEALELISVETRSQVGIWGNACPSYNLVGGPYSPASQPGHGEDFTLWETSENRMEALKYGEARSGGGFVMAIDSRTPMQVLTAMEESLRRSDEQERYDYQTCLALLCDWIEKIRWAYVPLDDEYGHAMFVTSHEHAQLARAVEHVLKERGIALARFEKEGGRFRWKAI